MPAQELPELSAANRIFAGLLGFGILLLLLTASRLDPDPRGFGTHEQLGLRACSFYRWTGRVCPTCGATTAWAHLLNGNYAAAVRANLAAAILGGLAVVGTPWLLGSAGFGRWLIVGPTMRRLLVVGTALAVVAGLDWLRRVDW